MIEYRWYAESNDGVFQLESNRAFSTKKECYDDMRDCALEKMKWNTEFDEDFTKGASDEENCIGYDVQFMPSKIIHKSYSGIYTYRIVEINNKPMYVDTPHQFVIINTERYNCDGVAHYTMCDVTDLPSMGFSDEPTRYLDMEIGVPLYDDTSYGKDVILIRVK